MKLRTVPVAVLVAFAVLIPANALAPAYATQPANPVFTNLDSSTAGHLTGTITSPGAPEVYIRFTQTGFAQYRHVTLAGTSGTFDASTAGYVGGTPVLAYACPDLSGLNCSAESLVGGFTPTQVTPSTTWSSDTTIGQAQNASVEVVNDTGGGLLHASWTPSGSAPDGSIGSFIAHDGQTLLNPPADGLGAFHLYRCNDVDTSQCVELSSAVSPTYDFEKSFSLTWDPVTEITPAHPDTSVQLRVSRAGTYDIDWDLLYTNSPTPETGIHGTATNVAVGVNGALQALPIPGATLFEGEHDIQGTVTVHTADFGDYSAVMDGSGATSPRVLVDRSGPNVQSISLSKSTIYPRINEGKYQGTVIITVHSATDDVKAIVIKSAGGTPIRTLQTPLGQTSVSGIWNGRDNAGALAAPGTYTVTAVDTVGNESSVTRTITLDTHRLIARYWSHTYSPASTLADKYVGKCSTLRKPSLRGWYNSFGYYANTRCSSLTSKYSLVATLHAIYLPHAAVYTDIRVSAYGGGSRARPSSEAVIRYVNTNGDWAYDKTMSHTMGVHTGYTKSTKNLVYPDRSFGWGVYTAYGHQYDVKSFTVFLHYSVLTY